MAASAAAPSFPAVGATAPTASFAITTHPLTSFNSTIVAVVIEEHHTYFLIATLTLKTATCLYVTTVTSLIPDLTT